MFPQHDGLGYEWEFQHDRKSEKTREETKLSAWDCSGSCVSETTLRQPSGVDSDGMPGMLDENVFEKDFGGKNTSVQLHIK